MFKYYFKLLYSCFFFSPQDGIAPNFTQKPTIKPDQDGKRLCFECKIKADPEPQIFWSRDNTEIANAGRYLIYCDKLPDNMFMACLEIDDVTMDDAGKYKVQAKNNLGESNASITLNFDSKPSSSVYIYVLEIVKIRLK